MKLIKGLLISSALLSASAVFADSAVIPQFGTSQDGTFSWNQTTDADGAKWIADQGTLGTNDAAAAGMGFDADLQVANYCRIISITDKTAVGLDSVITLQHDNSANRTTLGIGPVLTSTVDGDEGAQYEGIAKVKYDCTQQPYLYVKTIDNTLSVATAAATNEATSLYDASAATHGKLWVLPDASALSAFDFATGLASSNAVDQTSALPQMFKTAAKISGGTDQIKEIGFAAKLGDRVLNSNKVYTGKVQVVLSYDGSLQ